MSKCLARWHTASRTGAALLKQILDIETSLHLHEFLEELQLESNTDSCSPMKLQFSGASLNEPRPFSEARLQAIRRLGECLTSMEHSGESRDLVEICIATMWNVARPCLGSEFRHLIYRNIKKASDILECYQSSQISVRVQLAHQLAQYEVEQGLVNAARASLDKALVAECRNASCNAPKRERAVTGKQANVSTMATVVASASSMGPDSSMIETAELHSLTVCLERMHETVSILAGAPESCIPTLQLQHLVFNARGERSLEKVINNADDLRRKALEQLADEASKSDSCVASDDCQGSAKRALGSSEQTHASVVQKQPISCKGESTVKKLILAFGHLVSRAVQMGDNNATERAASALLSMVHGTEEYLDLSPEDAQFCGDTSKADLRIRLDPPFETEVAVSAVEAAYALAVCRSAKKHASSLRTREARRVMAAAGDGAIGSEGLLSLSKTSTSDLEVQHDNWKMPEEGRIQGLLLFGCRAIGDFALVQEFCGRAIPLCHASSRRAILGALLQDVMQQGRVAQPVLLRLFKSTSSAAADHGGASERVGKAKQVRGQVAATTEGPAQAAITPDVMVLLQIEKAMLEQDPATQEQVLLQCGDALAVATGAVTSAAAESTESAAAVNCELWTRLAGASLSTSSGTLKWLAVGYAYQALGQNHWEVPYKIISTPNHRLQQWRGMAHAFAGLGLLAADLTSPGRVLAMRHLHQACRYGKETQCTQLLLFSAKGLCNVALSGVHGEIDREETCSALKDVLDMIPASCRPASMPLLSRMYMGLLWILCASKRWDELLRTAKAAMLLLPKALHEAIVKLQIFSLTRTEPPHLLSAVRALIKGEASREADLLLWFARLARKKCTMQSIALEAYDGALKLLQANKDPQAVLVHLELAKWFFSMRPPQYLASSHVSAAAKLIELCANSRHSLLLSPSRDADSEVQKAWEESAAGVLRLEGVSIRLDHLLLLHTQTVRLLSCSDAPTTAEALRQILDVSSQMLTQFSQQTRNADSQSEDLVQQEGDGGAERGTMLKEASASLQDSQNMNAGVAAASLCNPICLKRVDSTAKSVTPAECSTPNQLPTAPPGEACMSNLLASCMHSDSGETRKVSLCSNILVLAFRSLAELEALLFELGMEGCALRLTQLRARVTEAFLKLSLGSAGGSSAANDIETVHPALCLLEASLNIQLFRAAVACGCLSEARTLRSYFSPLAIRTWIAKLASAREGNMGISSMHERQERCFSVVTVDCTCSLISLGELLVTLGEQCLLIGEVGLSSLLGRTASLYIPRSARVLRQSSDSLFARNVSLLARSRLRQGDVNGPLPLLDTIVSDANESELEVPLALNIAETLWMFHVAKGSLSKALFIVRQIETALRELATASSTSTGLDTKNLCLDLEAGSQPESPHSSQPDTTKAKCASSATPPVIRSHELPCGRRSSPKGAPQYLLPIRVCKHRLTELQVEHIFSLHCLGWTTEGGALPFNWLPVFLEAVDLLNRVLDPTEDPALPLKPLRACAAGCLRGTRFLGAAMRFMWSYRENFHAKSWKRRNIALAPAPMPQIPPLVTPTDLQKCIEALHQLLVRAHLESKIALQFIAAHSDFSGVQQSALVWADMIAVARAHLVCLRHQLQLATLELSRADLHEALECSSLQTPIPNEAEPIADSGVLILASTSAGGRPRELQQWLYDSQCEETFSPAYWKSEEGRLTDVIQELEALGTVGLSRCLLDKPSRFGDVCSMPLLDLQWLCQYAMAKHNHLSLQGRKRMLDQGKNLNELCPWKPDGTEQGEHREMQVEDIRSAVAFVEKNAKGQSRASNYLASVTALDSRQGIRHSLCSPELEEAFAASVAGGHLTEATLLGEELILHVSGNRNGEQLDRTFATIATLQAARVAQIGKLLHLQHMNPQLTESVAAQELRILADSYKHANALPQFQPMKALLESQSSFGRMTNIAAPSPLAILNTWLPTNCCVVALYCARGFIFLAAANPPVHADGSASAWRFFVERRALPECILLDAGEAGQCLSPLCRESKSTQAVGAPYSHNARVHALLNELFEAMETQLLQWSLEDMLAQGQSGPCSELRSHLLLLPDMHLSHFAFECLPALKRVFGCRIFRDFSLHMFALRMKTHDSSSSVAAQLKRTVVKMHTGFARDKLVLLPEAVHYSPLHSVVTGGYHTQEGKVQQPPLAAEAGCGAATGLEASKSCTRKKTVSPQATQQDRYMHDWRSTVAAELAGFPKSGSTDGSPETPPRSNIIPELLCSKNPQAAWALSLDKLVLRYEDLNRALAGMDLTHLSLLGLLSLRGVESAGSSVSASPHGVYHKQKAAPISKEVETLLLLSFRGVGTIVVADEALSDQQKADLAKRFLTEVAGSQTTVCAAL
ncbi:putative subtilisin-like protease [Cyclospora cayetanensis]|uniref:Subtilisin-like protease n=1 Tax=Cyclospora cayetanensis TaxID=88456 RepID=A0A1D3D2U7_9EIME|nr:putative subtilisin-like protease [Cyclospora cayetanensis]